MKKFLKINSLSHVLFNVSAPKITSEILFKTLESKWVLAIIIEWQYTVTYFYTLLTYFRITKAFLVEQGAI